MDWRVWSSLSLSLILSSCLDTFQDPTLHVSLSLYFSPLLPVCGLESKIVATLWLFLLVTRCVLFMVGVGFPEDNWKASLD